MSDAIKKVLLVEDDEQGVVPAEFFFDPELWEDDEGEPPTLLVARNPEEFEEIVKREGSSLDAIITDVVLKEGGPRSGVDVYDGLRHHVPDVPCIVITGYAHESEAVKAVRAGIVGYVRKPFKWDDLWRLLKDKVQISRLHHSTQAFQSALSEITRFLRSLEQLNAPDLAQHLLVRLVEVAVLATEADGGWVFTADAEETLHLKHTSGFPEPESKAVGEEGIFHTVFMTETEQCVSFQSQDEAGNLAPFEKGLAAILAVPLISETGCIGVLQVARNEGGPSFTQRQVSIMAKFAGLAAAAVETNRRDLEASNLLLRALKRAIDQESQSKGGSAAEIDTAFKELSQEAWSLEAPRIEAPEDDLTGLMESLRAIRGAGAHHLDFWKESLRRYRALLGEESRRD